MSGKAIGSLSDHHQVQKIRQISNLISAGINPALARELVQANVADADKNPNEKSADVDIELELIWQLSSRLGAPIAGSLSHLADNRERQIQNEKQIQLAFSTPSMTAKLIGWLPLGSLVLAQAVGLNPLGAITQNLLVALAVLFGLALLAVARYWSNRILLAAKPNAKDPALYINCVAMAIEAGLPPITAVRHLQTRLFDGSQDSELRVQAEKVDSLLALSAKTGAAVVGLLRSLAELERKEKIHLDNEKIAKLNIKLLLPIGLAILPAFGLLTIVPVAFGFLGSSR
jgi:tight adherence protein B